MISRALLDVVRCPDCRSALTEDEGELACAHCARRIAVAGRDYLDLRPAQDFVDSTKYLDEAMHADGRYARVTPPLLTAAIRNDMLRSFLDVKEGDRLVDLGCGSGRALVWNGAPGVHAVGVDVSPYFAEEARADYDLLVGDLRQLPLDDGAFTKAYSLDVLEHLSRDDLARMFSEASRILLPGGRFFAYSHVRKNSPLALGLRAINVLAQALERVGLVDLSHERLRKSDHRNPLADIADLREVAGRAGFRIVRLRYYTPLIGGFAENILKKLAERFMERTAARRQPAAPAGPGAPSTGDAARQVARSDAQRWIAKRGTIYWALRAVTWLMKLDVWLFGRIPNGPFFVLFERLPDSPDSAPERP